MNSSFNSQDSNPDQGIPSWLVYRLGKLVEARVTFDETGGYQRVQRGQRGILLSLSSRVTSGAVGVYATVAFDLADVSDETNVELSQLAPVRLENIRG